MGKRTAIAIIAEHDKLIEFDRQLEWLNKFAENRQAEIQKLAEELVDDINSKRAPIWDAIEEYLIESGLIPKGFRKTVDGIGFANGAVYSEVKDEDEPEGNKIMKRLLSKMFE